MTFLRKLPEILMVLGIITVIGAVGHDDYMIEIGQTLSLAQTMLKILLGVLLMVPESVKACLMME